MGELEDIRAAKAAAELEAELIVKAIDRAGWRVPDHGFGRQLPGGRVATELYGVDLHAFPDDDVGRARASLALHEARRDYLRGRHDELAARAERQQAAAGRGQGVGRFVGDGDLTLSQLVDATARSGPAMAELQRQQYEQRMETRQRVIEARKRLEEDSP